MRSAWHETTIDCKLSYALGSVCGGRIQIHDWGDEAGEDFRFEASCDVCLACDPNGFGTIEAAKTGAADYFKD